MIFTVFYSRKHFKFNILKIQNTLFFPNSRKLEFPIQVTFLELAENDQNGELQFSLDRKKRVSQIFYILNLKYFQTYINRNYHKNYSDSTLNFHVKMASQGKKWPFFGEHKLWGSKYYESIHISQRHFIIHGFEINRCQPFCPICPICPYLK